MIKHVCAGDGDLFTCGTNDIGQLAQPQHVEAVAISRVAALEASAVQSVACGEEHMVAVVDLGQLAAWGSNEFGQLGTVALMLSLHWPYAVQALHEL